MAKRSWPELIQAREAGAGRLPQLPQARQGVVCIDESMRNADVPGGLLSRLGGEHIHYLDVHVQLRSLEELGAPPGLWGGVTKLYACGCGLQRLDGVLPAACRLRYLYLNDNALPEDQLLRLLELPKAQLEALDVSNNPGTTPAVMDALWAGGLLSAAEFVNGQRVRYGPA